MVWRRIVIQASFLLVCSQSLIATANVCPPWVCGFNGPTLTGEAEEAPEPRLVDWPENTGMGNGPVLSDTECPPWVCGFSECPPWVCGFNGPTLTGRAEEASEPRLVDWPENTGMGHGPALSGTRAAGHGLLPPPAVPLRVPPLARPDAP